MNQNDTSKLIGVIVIGRNEGQHLKACLLSVLGEQNRVVYVDSGSTDESVLIARNAGVDVVELDHNREFTAARARNEGMRHLKAVAPECDLVQFVDGDCCIELGWLEAAQQFLAENPNMTIVCGLLRERFPERTIYNYMCDVEWGGPTGEIRACGGVFMMRTSMYYELSGFREDLRAGEEPEFCLRVRQQGGKVWRNGSPMALHDVDLHRFGDWWKRMRRAGYAYAEVSYLHKDSSIVIWMHERRRAQIWGMGIPCGILLLSLTTPYALCLLAIYPMKIVRIAARNRRRISRPVLFAVLITIANFAEAAGVIRYWIHQIRTGVALQKRDPGKTVQS